MTATPLVFALRYSRLGWPVFPLRPNDKVPLGALAPHGCLDATSDVATIRRWWSEVPEAGVGLRTGRASGLVALDIDPQPGGLQSLAQLEAEHGPLPDTVEAVTGGGGRHLLFAYPAGDIDIRNAVKLGGLPGLDVRGENGYLAVAPTIHPSGKVYRWKTGHTPDLKPAPLPAWLLVLMTAHSTSEGNGNGNGRLDMTKILDGVPQGERDVYLWGLACKLRGADVPKEMAYELVGEAARNAKPPVEDRIAYDKVKRAYATYEAGRPRVRQEPAPSVSLQPATAEEVIEDAARPIDFAIKPIIVNKSIGLLTGAGKTTKTLTAIKLGLNADYGGTLAGHFEGQGGHSVAWFDFESTRRSWSRKFVAACRGLDIDPGETIRTSRFSYFNVTRLYLDIPENLEAVIKAGKTIGASIVVLDSLTRMHNQKENDANAMSRFFTDSIFRIRDEVVASVLVLHHTRKGIPGFRDDPADAGRGTGDFHNVVDTHLALSRSRKDRSIFLMTVAGQRDVPDAGPFSWRLDWTPESGAKFEHVETEAAEIRGAPGRPSLASEAAARIIQGALSTDPELTCSKAISLCPDVSPSTVKRAWRKLHNE